MTLRRREVTEILKKKHSIALCGNLVLEETMGMSEDRLQDEWMNEWMNERKKERQTDRRKEWMNVITCMTL